MTRHGKCETCRKRKVKCDEKWPMCGPCSVKRRPCHYTESSPFIHGHKSFPAAPEVQVIVNDLGVDQGVRDGITLRLKRYRKAHAGQGEFLTFEPVKPSSPSPSAGILDPQSKMATNLGSIFGYAALDLAPLGPWFKLGWPSGNGTSPCVELASEYALESVVTFQHMHSEQSLQRASKVGSTALRSLQSGIESCSDAEKESLLVAVMLHFAAENFGGISNWRYIPHVQGICRLLASFFKNQSQNQFVQNVVSLICDHEMSSAVHFGLPSQLEPYARTQYSLNVLPSIDVATTLVDGLLIRLPRLICSVRACIQNETGLEGFEATSELAKNLYHSNEALWVEKTVEEHSWTISPDNTTSPTGTAFDFDSVPAYVLATRYYFYRMLICGLLQTITAVDTDNLFFSADFHAEAEQNELAAATSIAQGLDFALRPSPAQALITVAMIMPLEGCVGAWLRVRRRNVSDPDSLKYQQAVQMIDWCIGHLQVLSARWRAGEFPRKNMEDLYDVFVGGPLVANAYAYYLQRLETGLRARNVEA